VRAAWYTRQGPAPEVLEVGSRPDPEPGPGEVLVAVRTSAVNPSDVKARDGTRALSFPLVIPHSDGAGEVVAVGDGVPARRVGERVWVYQAQWRRPFGTAAELAAVPQERAVPLPHGVGFEVGACLGIPAMTGHRCVLADGLVDRAVVLVWGAGGRVGFYATQIARLAGAMVIATAGSDETLELAERAGADIVVDHRDEPVADRVLEATGGRGADRVVDVEFGQNLPDTVRALADNGVVCAYASMELPRPELPFYDLMFRNHTLRTVLIYEMPEAAKQQAVADLTRWLEAEALQHHLGPRFRLDDIAAAHEAVEGGARGVVLVEVAG
jgi:NADPH:quinone reductase